MGLKKVTRSRWPFWDEGAAELFKLRCVRACRFHLLTHQLDGSSLFSFSFFGWFVLLFQQKRNLFFMSVPCCSIHPLRAPKKKYFSSSSNSLFECSLSFSWKQDKKTNKQSNQLIKTRRALGPELLLDYVREPCIGRVVVVVGQRGAPNIITRRPRSAFGELWNLHINRK